MLTAPTMRILPAVVALCVSVSVAIAQKPFSVADALSAPFMNQLTAAPSKSRVAWFVDDEGKRNVWAASPSEKARSLTHYTQDDGQDIDDIIWSPDGERVAYTHGTGPDGSEHPVAANPAHLQEDVQQRVDIATWDGAVRVVGAGHKPVFSVDGRRMFYLHEGKIYAADVTDAAKQPEQLVIAEGHASQLRPSLDGAKLAFVSERGDHSFIGVFTFATKTLEYVDPGTGKDHDPVWSADSRRIAFIRESPVLTELDLRWMRSVPVPWSIRMADVASGEGRQIWQADKGTGSLFHEMVATNQLLGMKDGRIVFAWEKTGWLHLYSLLPGEKQAKELTPGEFEIDDVVTDGERIVYSSNQVAEKSDDIDRKHIWSVEQNRPAPEPATWGTGLETNPTILANGQMAAMQANWRVSFAPVLLMPRPFQKGPLFHTCAINGLQRDINRCEAGAGLTPLVPYHASPAHLQRSTVFVEPKMVVFPASDGLSIHGQWFLPTNAKPGDKLPTIVFFHGGSRRQMLLGYNAMQYYAQAYELNQYFVSRGYAVLSVNYRSGTGYGMEFRQAKDYGVFGGSEYRDIEGAVKWLKAQPNVDAKRIGAWGGSYGGYMTALALARDSADFVAGVDLHGVHDWSFEMDSWKQTSDPNYDAAARAKIAFAASPMADVAKWKSPVLLMQGDDDRNVLFGQTVRLAAALRAEGVDVEEKIFPDEVHDFLLHRNWVAAYQAAADFFDRKLKGK
ncbi:prolyl oligopeptidase family serine peptidase [Terriglobus sp. TAA 43]|uniref:S9 family peptidase n=1 Tax=Terriglobus sp. TAA 43 TaxID=278961 RepID=UPI00068FD261|nr:prolyl oligopeptidase family serine peptidase [Terriglobus sp. TAA 43]